MTAHDKVNILLVDDQPGKLLTYEAILRDLGENLLKASSGREALEHLLKSEVAVVLVDVCMPDLDGFQLAAMIREHPRYQKTAMIFISAIHLSDVDRLRGYEMGAVDYVPVPVIPEVLRAKVKIFAELYRKTRQLERLNAELEERVAERTAELEASTAQLRRASSAAISRSSPAAWARGIWDRLNGDCMWDEGQHQIFGVDPKNFTVTPENIRALLHPDDWAHLETAMETLCADAQPYQAEFRVRRPNGEMRWCFGTAAPSVDADNNVVRVSGVTIDITDRKEAEERQNLLAREVDHRAKNALALVQSIVRLTRTNSVDSYVAAVEGRIKALSRAHTVLSLSRWQGADLGGLVEEELAPYRTADASMVSIQGPQILLQPATAQTLALALHELVTNAAKYGALSSISGRVEVIWEVREGGLEFHWSENGGPETERPAAPGFGTRIIMASIERQLGGSVKFEWRSKGLRCTFSVPRSKLETPERLVKARRAVDKDKVILETKLVLAGNRILVVEDEALVALAVSEAINELGFAVVGPFSSVSAAIPSIEKRDADAAILDVNLGGELVYPLAEMLTTRGVPFIFVTGYGVESIDHQFAHIPILQKPIERQMLQRLFGTIAPAALPRDTGVAPRHVAS